MVGVCTAEERLFDEQLLQDGHARQTQHRQRLPHVIGRRHVPPALAAAAAAAAAAGGSGAHCAPKHGGGGGRSQLRRWRGAHEAAAGSAAAPHRAVRTHHELRSGAAADTQ